MKAFNKFPVNFIFQDFPLRLNLLQKFSAIFSFLSFFHQKKADVYELANTHPKNRCETRKRELLGVFSTFFFYDCLSYFFISLYMRVSCNVHSVYDFYFICDPNYMRV